MRELAADEVAHRRQVAVGGVAAGTGLGGLDAAVVQGQQWRPVGQGLRQRVAGAQEEFIERGVQRQPIGCVIELQGQAQAGVVQQGAIECLAGAVSLYPALPLPALRRCWYLAGGIRTRTASYRAGANCLPWW